MPYLLLTFIENDRVYQITLREHDYQQRTSHYISRLRKDNDAGL